MKGIIHYQTEEYGCIKVKLSGVLKSLGITRNQLRTLTGVKYEVIDRYYKGEDILNQFNPFHRRVQRSWPELSAMHLSVQRFG